MAQLVLPFAVVEDFPILEVTAQFPRLQAERRVLLAGFDQQCDSDDYAAGNQCAFAYFEEAALQVVAHGDQIPASGLDCELRFFEIGNLGIDSEAQLGGAMEKGFDGGG